MGLITLLKNYLRWTQAVVVAPLIAGAKRHRLKVAWSLVLLATTVAFLVQSYYLFTNHLAYKTTANTKLIYEPEATFPAVTFCNLNPFKKSMVEQSPELKNLVATYIYVIKVKQAQIRSGITAQQGVQRLFGTKATHGRSVKNQETTEPHRTVATERGILMPTRRRRKTTAFGTVPTEPRIWSLEAVT